MPEVTRDEFNRLETICKELQEGQAQIRERTAAQEAVATRLEDDVREVGRKVDTLSTNLQGIKTDMKERFDQLDGSWQRMILKSAGAGSGVAAALYWIFTNVPAAIAFLHHTIATH